MSSNSTARLMVGARASRLPRMRDALLVGAFIALANCGGDSPVSVASIVVTAPRATIYAGQSTQLVATLIDASGASLGGRSLSWESSNPQAATVSASGVVSAVGFGTTDIVARSGSASGQVAITVAPVPVTRLDVSAKNVSLFVTQTLSVTATPRDSTGAALDGRTVEWSSGQPAVATVANGVITAVSPGLATISAQSGGQTATILVQVVRIPVASVAITPPEPTVEAGFTQQLSASALDSLGRVIPGRTVLWSISDTAATVSGTGLVVGRAVGTARVTATVEDKATTALLRVVPPHVARGTVEIGSLDGTIRSLNSGWVYQAYVTLFDALERKLPPGRIVDWSSSNPAVLSFGGTRTEFVPVEARDTGQAVITATSEGVSASLALRVVLAPVTKVTLGYGSGILFYASSTIAYLAQGDTASMTSVLTDAERHVLTGRTLEFASSDTSVLKIDRRSGKVLAVGDGTATISLTSEGVSDSKPLRVNTYVLRPGDATAHVGERLTVYLTEFLSGNRVDCRTQFTLTSSNPGVIKASGAPSPNGGFSYNAIFIDAIAPGTATVNARCSLFQIIAPQPQGAGRYTVVP